MRKTTIVASVITCCLVLFAVGYLAITTSFLGLFEDTSNLENELVGTWVAQNDNPLAPNTTLKFNSDGTGIQIIEKAFMVPGGEWQINWWIDKRAESNTLIIDRDDDRTIEFYIEFDNSNRMNLKHVRIGEPTEEDGWNTYKRDLWE